MQHHALRAGIPVAAADAPATGSGILHGDIVSDGDRSAILVDRDVLNGQRVVVRAAHFEGLHGDVVAPCNPVSYRNCELLVSTVAIGTDSNGDLGLLADVAAKGHRDVHG